MGAADKAKEAGLKSLAEMGRIANKNVVTLNNWFKDNRQLFDVVLAGCVVTKNKGR